MKNFEYSAAATIDEAVSLLAARGERAKVLAGGPDVLVQLREGQREADLVVDIKKIPEFMRLTCASDSGLSLGAGVPCVEIYGDPEVATQYAALVDSTEIIGGWQIQSRASVGGNLCNASPAADAIPTLMVYQATCEIAGPSGHRQVNVADFCTGPGQNQLAAGELLVSLELPPQPEKSGAAYQRFIPRNEMDIAVVGAASWVRLSASGDTIEEARVALAAVGPTPIMAEEA